MPANRRAWAVGTTKFKETQMGSRRRHLRYESVTESRWAASIFRHIE